MPPLKKSIANDGVNFLDLGFYTQGGGMPEGDYALEFNVQMYQATTQAGVSRGPARLGVMITAHSLTDPSAEPRTQFYSMGKNAHLSFAPNPETGKGLVAVPGGPASSLNNSTNWAIFLKSLFDSGLPENLVANDLSPLDGIHTHLHNIPEPEERKSFAQAATAEVQEEPRKPGNIAVVSAILEDGMPWEGGGGIPEKTAAAPAAKATNKVAGKIAPKAAPVAAKAGTKPAAKPVAKAPVEAPADDGSDVATAAQNGIAVVLENNPNGLPKLKLRIETLKAVKASDSEEMATAVIDTYFSGDDDALNGLLGELGFQFAGGQVKPV